MKKILNTKKYTLFLAMIFLGACNEAEKPKVSNSPCDFSFDFSFGEELQEVLSCISTHFPIGSDPTGLHEYLMVADFSSVNIAVDNPRNYLKDRHDLSSRRDQFLVYL